MICSPVIQAELSEARKTAMEAISPGWAIRPSGVWEIAPLSKSESIRPALCVPSVSTTPGFSEFTRLFLGPSSRESAPVMASTAP
jgi:hypothetical protein